MVRRSARKVRIASSAINRLSANHITRLRTANILLIGLKALGNEIAKNLVLAGIGALTVIDDGIVTEDDLGAQFFVSEEHVGMNVSPPNLY